MAEYSSHANGAQSFTDQAPMSASDGAANAIKWMIEKPVNNILPPVISEQAPVKVICDRNPGKDCRPEYSIFVGNLDPEVDNLFLVSHFQSRFSSCKSAKIITDAMTGRSRGYGFVHFSNEMDQQRALVEMQGMYCGNRAMRISTANLKTHSHQYRHGKIVAQWQGLAGHIGWGVPPQHNLPGSFNPIQPINQFNHPNNTTIFVGGLSNYVTEHQLWSFFQGFGEIIYVKILIGKGCGFVHFFHRNAAEVAMNQMQGQLIGNSRVRLSWGRSKNNPSLRTPYRPVSRLPNTTSSQTLEKQS